MINASDDIKRRIWLYFGVIANVGVLAFFKLSHVLWSVIPELFKINNIPAISSIALPIGISFYTFSGLSYIIDVYRKRIKPTRNYIEHSTFTSFFPVLTSGPIERVSHLLPQLQKARVFDANKTVDGLRQILWGGFKKIVIADGCAQYVNMIFNNSNNYSGSTLVLGAVLFSFQIYADFSGYSDIALGSARILGIELTQNFAFPYFSRDIAEFWRRWHISLSSWFRDYVFFPLERRRNPFLNQSVNTVIVFLLTGLWHGANWTFIAWGGLNALYFLLFFLPWKHGKSTVVVAQGKWLPSVREFFKVGFTFCMTTFAWIFFRADSLGHAARYVSGIFSQSLFIQPEIMPSTLLILIFVFMSLEWAGREQKYAIAQFAINWPTPIRWAFYYSLIFVTLYFSGSPQQFIYSQF